MLEQQRGVQDALARVGGNVPTELEEPLQQLVDLREQSTQDLERTIADLDAEPVGQAVALAGAESPAEGVARQLEVSIAASLEAIGGSPPSAACQSTMRSRRMPPRCGDPVGPRRGGRAGRVRDGSALLPKRPREHHPPAAPRARHRHRRRRRCSGLADPRNRSPRPGERRNRRPRAGRRARAGGRARLLACRRGRRPQGRRAGCVRALHGALRRPRDRAVRGARPARRRPAGGAERPGRIRVARRLRSPGVRTAAPRVHDRDRGGADYRPPGTDADLEAPDLVRTAAQVGASHAQMLVALRLLAGEPETRLTELP